MSAIFLNGNRLADAWRDVVRIDVSRVLFSTVSIICGLGLSFAFGPYSGANETVLYKAVTDLKTRVEEALETTFEEASTLSRIHPKHFLQPARYEGSGVTVNDVPDETDLILLSGFFGDTNELRLIRRDGSVVVRWPVRFWDVFPNPSHLTVPPATDWNVDTHGALVLADGSVVFNFEGSGLVKLDRCGDLIWALPRKTHHSVERAEDGGYWVPGRRVVPQQSDSTFSPFEAPLVEDTLLRVSEDGEVLAEISVPGIFYDNGLEALLTATGHSFQSGMEWDREIVHLNKIQELTSDLADDFPLFEAGDLALSIREMNLVMVIDPETREIKWLRIGPWLRQHDPEFKAGGTIVVFNNNLYRTVYGTGPETSQNSIPRVSNLIEIDPVSGTYRVIYGGSKGQEMLSVVRGKHDITRKNGFLITEFEGGRVFEVDAEGHIIWEYINRYSEEEVAEITEARVYPRNYFSVSDWTCEATAE